MNLNELSKDIRFFNQKKGFECNIENINQKLLLAISEICEAQEELRDGRKIDEIYYTSHGETIIESKESNKLENKPCGFPVEVADAIIRLLDICGAFNIDIEEIIDMKLAYNKTRPAKHGRKF
jgi:hypothetical protein